MNKKKVAVFIVAILAIVSLAVVGAIAKQEENRKVEASTQEVEQNVEEQEAKTVEVVLYFSDENSEKLIAEKRIVNYETYKQNASKVVVEELIKGPLDSKLYSVVPEGTKLLAVEVNDRKAVVDLSKEFIDNHNGGSSGEIMTIYGIVNSLTELKDIDSVEFKIEGESREEFKGHLVFNEAFVRNEEIIG